MKTAQEMSTTSNRTRRIVTRTMSGLLVVLLGLATTARAQEVFRWVDKAGKVHYGDMLPPPAEGKNVQTKKLQDSVIEQDAVPYGVSTAMKNNPVTLYANSCGEACTNANGGDSPQPGRSSVSTRRRVASCCMSGSSARLESGASCNSSNGRISAAAPANRMST